MKKDTIGGWFFTVIGVFGLFAAVVNWANPDIPVVQYWGVVVLSLANLSYGVGELKKKPEQKQ